MKTLTVSDFVEIIKDGNVDENHRELEKKVDNLSNEDRKYMIIQMTYVLDALRRKK